MRFRSLHSKLHVVDGMIISIDSEIEIFPIASIVEISDRIPKAY